MDKISKWEGKDYQIVQPWSSALRLGLVRKDIPVASVNNGPQCFHFCSEADLFNLCKHDHSRRWGSVLNSHVVLVFQVNSRLAGVCFSAQKSDPTFTFKRPIRQNLAHNSQIEIGDCEGLTSTSRQRKISEPFFALKKSSDGGSIFIRYSNVLPLRFDKIEKGL